LICLLKGLWFEVSIIVFYYDSLLPLYSGSQVMIRIRSASHKYKLSKALLCKQFSYLCRHIMMAIFSWLLLWFPNEFSSVIIYVLRIPADDSKPHILPLQTIDVFAEGNVNCCFICIPDMRAFWGREDGWKWRDIVQCMITNQNSDINGVYLAWKSFAMHLLPLNKNASGCGDVFIARLKNPEWDEHDWTAYEDVSNELLDSGLYRRVLKCLAKN